MLSSTKLSARRLPAAALAFILCFLPVAPSLRVAAQDTLTGAFEGYVTERAGGAPVVGVVVQFESVERGAIYTQRTDASGFFRQDLLLPGAYVITVKADPARYQQVRMRRYLQATVPHQITPLPIVLDAVVALPVPTPVPAQPAPGNPVTPAPSTPTTPAPTPQPHDETVAEQRPVPVNRTDGRRDGGFTSDEVVGLPLGSTTLVRTFDELALLLPGVALPPQTLSRIPGPGVGPGIGSAGQFAVNGMPSRANNFTIDGSDNNDEDIGVRRQGFLSLVPQPIESIREYQVITLLAPAQYGRNIGAQVNAISLSGTNQHHGTVYGFLSGSNLSSRNFFDTTNGNGVSALTAGNNQSVILRTGTFNFDPTRPIVAGNGSLVGLSTTSTPFTVQNQSGGKDSSTLFTPGFVLGGPLKRDKAFYFISFEKQVLNASQEASFAVPTLEQRGFTTAINSQLVTQGSGATGLFQNCINVALSGTTCTPTNLQGQTLFGAAIFSLFPFPNNPGGVYGANTFTQTLPANGRGIVLSGKLDYAFKRLGEFTARYNFTEDHRQVPVTGGALFSSIEPQVKTQNISTYLNSALTSHTLNQLRLSYGRTHINFNEVRDQQFLVPSARRDPFLLNAPLLMNITTPQSAGVANTGNVTLVNITNLTTENITGPLGQVLVGGYSPVGVDPFNFPQRRTNNTYQLADTLAYRIGKSNYAFGADLRRTELNSFLPTNSRATASFFGGLPLQNNPASGGLFTTNRFGFFRPEDFVAAGVPTSFTQALSFEDPTIGLRYYQLNFFAQDEWRPRRNLSISYGARYEYNTPARERQNRIENAFATSSSASNLLGGLGFFLDGRTSIYDPDRNNIAPRVGIAWSPQVFGPAKSPVFRGGFGVFYDQILGSVVSQSRNVFPLSFPINFAAGNNFGGNNPVAPTAGLPLNFFNPTTLAVAADAISPCFAVVGQNRCLLRSNPLTATPIPLLQAGTLNTLNPAFRAGGNFNLLLAALQNDLPGGPAFTLPAKNLPMPMAYHYSYSVEQPLPHNMIVSAAYVGTLGRNLLRFNSPNGGSNLNPFVNNIAGNGFTLGTGQGPQLVGGIVRPIRPIGTTASNGTPNNVGPINVFETSGRSRYDAAQFQLRGRLGQDKFLYQVAYTFSKSFDDVSDVFDLAGTPALPQDFRTFAGEYSRSSFDTPHRFSYNFIYNFGRQADRGGARSLLDGWQVSGTGQVQSGQPFTVNSIIDVNEDGNLTDRLNSTSGLNVTGNREQPISLTSNTPAAIRALLAGPGGNSGVVPRNFFRAGNVVLLNLAVTKTFKFRESQNLVFRAEAFNFINRDNFGIPVRFLEAVGFGRATDTVTPNRRLQFALKYSF